MGAWRIRGQMALVLLLLVQTVQSQDRQLGVNLTDVSPFGTLWYYSNALKQSTGWLVYNADNEADAINLSSEITADIEVDHFDAHGYPLQVPFESGDARLASKNLVVSALVLNGQPEPYLYPAGTYQLSFQGTGIIAMQGDVDGGYMEFDEAESHPVPISAPSTIGLQLFILESNPDDPIRNVELFFPGYHEQNPVPKYQEGFLELAAQFGVLRFMKPLKSENNTIVNFSDRSTQEDFSYFLDVENQILKGMPYEDVVEISNLTGSDPWITIPYLASDEYVTSTAELFRQLDPDLDLHVEYSNETWNPAYPETRAYMLEMGEQLTTSDIPEVAEFEAIHRYHALRSLEIWGLFENVLSEPARLVRVHGSQSDPYTADLVRDAYMSERVNPEHRQPDVIAIASYIGVTLFDDLREQNIEICNHTPQQLLDTLMNRIAPELEEMVSRYQELFGSSGIDIVAYEGGQHVTELNFQAMEPCAAQLVAEMNELPGMTDFFCTLLDTWYDTYGGGVFNVFNLAERPDDFGAFGLLQSQWQHPDTSPKWMGVMDCMEDEVLMTRPHPVLRIYPNPASKTLILSNQDATLFEIRTLSGSVMKHGQLQPGLNKLDIASFPSGLYLLIINGPSNTAISKVFIKS